jgi:hypothetical protein
MLRERALKVVLVLIGLLFTAAIYPAVSILRGRDLSNTGDGMMMAIYFTLGIFLLLAVRNPSAHRSLIAFAAWSSFAHALEMGTMGFQFRAMRNGFLIGSAILVVIGVVLLALFPGKERVDHPPSTPA